MTTIRTLDALRARYPQPVERSLAKELTRLENHCRHFIQLSPFVVIASVDAEGHTDASPRGGAPGFVRAVDDTRVVIPDSAGNNRLDTLTNIVSSGEVSLLFMIPGINETLRINGRGRLTDDEELMDLFTGERHPPRLLVEVTVARAYLQCPKAFMRSRLWDPEARVARSTFPSLAQMIKEQAGLADPAETQREAEERYSQALDLDG